VPHWMAGAPDRKAGVGKDQHTLAAQRMRKEGEGQQGGLSDDGTEQSVWCSSPRDWKRRGPKKYGSGLGECGRESNRNAYP
jgi:hypothetical protein